MTDSLRAARWLLLALAVGAAAGGQEDARPKIAYSPEVQVKLAAFVKKAGAAKRMLWDLRMKKEIDAVAKVTLLDGKGREALGAAARNAVDRCAEVWCAKVAEACRLEFNRTPDQASRTVDQLLSEVDGYVSQEWISDYVRPTEHAAWKEGLRRTLTAGQLADWEKAQAARNLSMGGQIAEFLKGVVEQDRMQVNETILAESGQIKLLLALPKERAAKLDALENEAVDKSAEKWRERAKKVLLSMDDDAIRETLKCRDFFLATDENELPKTIWNGGLAALLTPDEMKRVQASREDRVSKRVGVLARVMLAELDEKAAFTESQRQALEPVAERLVRGVPWLYSDDVSESGGPLHPGFFSKAESEATDEELRPILEPVQSEQWRKVCAPQSAAASDADPPQSPEPADFESAVSDFLQEKTADMRKQVLAAMMLRAEDASRVARLSPEAFSRLATAARGASERFLGVWRSHLNEGVRAFLGDADARNVKRRLDSAEEDSFDYSYAQFSPRDWPQNSAVWTTAVDSELNAQQRAGWQKEIDERSAYQLHSIVLAIVEAFDSRYFLEGDQWQKIESIVSEKIKECSGSDFDTFFTASRWYEDFYAMFIPLAAVPDKDMKAILTPAQWDRWSTSRELSISTMYWNNILQIRRARGVARGRR